MRHDISNQLLKVYRRWRRFAKSLQLRSTTRADDGSLDTSPAGKIPVPVAGQMTRPTYLIVRWWELRNQTSYCHMWEQDLCTPINWVGLLYIWKSKWKYITMKYFSTVFVKDEWISFFSYYYDFFWKNILRDYFIAYFWDGN